MTKFLAILVLVWNGAGVSGPLAVGPVLPTRCSLSLFQREVGLKTVVAAHKDPMEQIAYIPVVLNSLMIVFNFRKKSELRFKMKNATLNGVLPGSGENGDLVPKLVEAGLDQGMELPAILEILRTVQCCQLRKTKHATRTPVQHGYSETALVLAVLLAGLGRRQISRPDVTAKIRLPVKGCIWTVKMPDKTQLFRVVPRVIAHLGTGVPGLAAPQPVGLGPEQELLPAETARITR